MQADYVRHLRGYGADLCLIAVSTVLWGGLCFGILQLSGSGLPKQILRRRSKAAA